MEAVKVLRGVQHKTALWQGFIYETERGKKRVCNAHFDWELTPERESALNDVVVDIPAFLATAYGDREQSALFRKLMSGNMNPMIFRTLEQSLEQKLGKKGAEQAIQACFN